MVVRQIERRYCRGCDELHESEGLCGQHNWKFRQLEHSLLRGSAEGRLRRPINDCCRWCGRVLLYGWWESCEQCDRRRRKVTRRTMRRRLGRDKKAFRVLYPVRVE